METSLQELQAVKQSPYDFQKFSLDSGEYKSRKESIKKLFSGIQSLFTSFGVKYHTFIPLFVLNILNCRSPVNGRGTMTLSRRASQTTRRT